ncbi:hypothetical protein B0T25DRAFT_245337 [Lasiosphaeria hispida]|uniref:Uncharacterized protein n=1 Tax=Lasiosphaeria hispida TaxID=260671 RepID=A0AAJ0HER9_9PEZI|nr:hypothetical protein B0T25DRAFT_245337 [Lasiosphaeria hispida]
MECFAIPYGGIGILGDIVSCYIFCASCVTSLLYVRKGKYGGGVLPELKSIQMLACAPLNVYTLQTCGGCQDLLFVGVVRTTFIPFVAFLIFAGQSRAVTADKPEDDERWRERGNWRHQE